MRPSLRPLLAGLAAVSLAGCPKEEPPACGPFEEVFAYQDEDGDGFGSTKGMGWTCELAAGQSTNQADCDDTNDVVHPGAAEDCDGLDNDCNDQVDEGNAFVPWYPDEDADGYGDDRGMESDCAAPGPTWLRTSGDCDDGDEAVNPGVAEVCNDGVDDDCDGRADDEDAGVDPTTSTRYYFDGDGDGYGDVDRYLDRCAPPGAGTEIGGDCDDERDDVNPGEREKCNRDRDDDCDGLADDADPSVNPNDQIEFHADVDGDGYGDPAAFSLACVPTPGIGVANADDCDDTDPWANLPQDWYDDSDGDGAGGGPSQAFQCLNPEGGLVPEQNGVDCEPANGSIFPLQREDCFDGVDQNCNDLVDCADAHCGADPGCVPPCADWAVAPASLPSSTPGDTTGEADDFGGGGCGTGGAGAGDLFYWFTPPVSGLVTAHLNGAVWDTSLFVLDACGGAEITCNDDFFGLASRVQFNATAGIPVLIIVDGFGSSEGPFDLQIN